MPDYDITLSAGLDIKDIQTTAGELQEDIRNIFDAASGQNLSKPFQSLLLTLDRLYTRSNDLSQKMEELKTKKIPTEEYTEVQNQIDKTKEKLNALIDKQEKYVTLGVGELSKKSIYEGKDENYLKGIVKDSKAFKSMQYDVDQLTKALSFAQGDLQNLVDTGQAFTLGKDTPEYDKLATELGEVNNKTITTITQLNTLEDSENNTNTSTLNLVRGFTTLGSSVLHAGAQLVKTAASIPIKTFERTAVAIANCAKNAAKLASNAIISGIKKLSSAITGIGKSSNGAEKLMKKGLRMLLRYGVGVRSFYFLFRKIRSAISEGFKDLAQVHEPFNIAVSNIITAFNQLKGSLTAAFAPIVQYVEPILVHFMNIITEVINRIGMLIAALTGKDFVKAIAVQQDFADSLTTTAEKEKQAREEQKRRRAELKRQQKEQQKLNKTLDKTIASFDDLNILKNNKDDNDSDDDYDDDYDIELPELPKVDYTTLPVDDAFKNFADRLKEMFAKADFTDLGKLLGEKLRDALNNIPWDKIKEVLRNIAKSIATFLAGFIETPGLAEAIGNTLAEMLNSAFEILYTFAKNFPFDSLGTFIGTSIKSALDKIDWPLIYNTFREWGKGLADALNSFLQTPGLFESLGTTLGNAISAIFTGLYYFISNYETGSLGHAIATFLNNALGTIQWDVIQSTLGTLGTKLADDIKQFISDANWEGEDGVGETIGELFNSAVKFVFNFVNEDPFNGLGEKVAGALNTAMGKGRAGWILLKQTVLRLFTQALRELYKFSEKFDFIQLATDIRDAISEALEKDELWEQACKTLYSWFHNICKFLRNALPTEGQWRKLGERVAELLNSVDWVEILKTGLTLLKEAFFGFFTGLGSTTAGKVVLGFIAFKVTTTMILPFVNSILTAFGAPTVGTMLGGAIANAINGGAASAAGSLSANSSGFLALAGKFSAILAGLFVGFSLTNGDTSKTEDWQNINQIISDTGDAIDILGHKGEITSGQMDALYRALGTVQTQGFSSQEAVQLLGATFAACGITGEQLNEIAGNVGLNMSDVAMYTDSCTISYQGLQDVLPSIQQALGLTDTQFQELTSEIDANKEAGLSSQEWYDLVIQKLQDMGFNTDEAISIMESRFPSINQQIQETSEVASELPETVGTAVTDIVDTTSTGVMDEAQTTSDALVAIQGGVDTATQAMATSVDTYTSEAKDTATTNMDTMEKNVSGSMHDLDKNTSGHLSNVKDSVVDNINEAKKDSTTDANTMNTDISGSFSDIYSNSETEFTKLYLFMSSQFEAIKGAVNLKTSELVGELHRRFKTLAESLPNHFSGIGDTIASKFEETSWWTLGFNIIEGIYNGVLYNSGRLYALAWNTAVEMYNSAARALGVASPSKKFAWIGKMVDEGWGGGIEDNKDIPIDTAKSVAEDIVDTANDVDPTVTLDTQLNNTTQVLADVLDKYSTTIVNNFTDLISTLNKMADLPNSLAISQGRVVPYSALNTSSSRYPQTDRQLEELSGKLDTLIDTRITQSDIIDIVRRYLSWSIGDEQIARHANAGNAKLDRRLHPVRGGA